VRYRVQIVEMVQTDGTEDGDNVVEGQPIFVTTIDHKPDLGKLVEALKAPRVRKSRAKSA